MMTQAHFLRDMQNLVFDRYQRISPRPYDPQAPVRILDIDDESLERFGQWPWPRTLLSDIVDKLKGAGAVAIAFDMGFAEADRNSPEQIVAGLPPGAVRDGIAQLLKADDTYDMVFARHISGAGVVLGAILIEKSNNVQFPVKFGLSETGDPALPFLYPYPGAIVPLAPLVEAASGLGALNWVPDRDQIIRTVPLFFSVNGKAVPSLVAETLRVAQDAPGYILRSSNASGETSFGTASGVNAVRIGQAQIQTGGATDLRPRFSHSDQRRFIPAWRLLANEVPRTEIEGRIVFIGTSAAGLRDQRATPIDASVPGVEIHAQLTENILDGRVLIRPDWASGLELFVSIAIGLVLAALIPIISPLWGAIGGGVVAGLLLLGSFLLYEKYGLLTDAVIPNLAGGVVYLNAISHLWRNERAQRRYVRTAFGKYVSPAVVEQLVNNPEKLAIGGETRILTVMFVDLRSFTTISEGMDAPAITRFMNEYLTPLTDIIIEENGTVDKYMGDAIMAFWNAPLDDPEHARNAVRAALRMRQALADLNISWTIADKAAGRRPKLVRFGIGLNTGACSVGNMGSLRRFDYSAMGDSVNLASRLEGASKQYGVDILVNESTYNGAPGFPWIEVDRLRVKGKTQPSTVFSLLNSQELSSDADIREWLERHEAFQVAYRNMNFIQAAELVGNLAADAPPGLKLLYTSLAGHLARLTSSPTPPDWDGARSLDEK
jgi:adenylate cyclase